MLMLTRKYGESILIGDNIKIVVVQTGRTTVKLGIEAPPNIGIRRGELKKKVTNFNH